MKSRKNVLIVRNDRFGEFLLNIPAIRAVKETFVEANIILAVDPRVKELAEKVPCVDEILTWRSGRHSLSEIFKFANLLKNKNIGTVIIMNPSKDTNIAVCMAGIPVRVGYSHKWDFLLTKKIEDLKHLSQKHEVEYNLDLVKIIGAETKDKTLVLKIDNVISKENVIVIHPWTSDPVKQWPEERFCALALKIIKETGSDVLIVGGPEELQKGKMFDGLDKRIKNLTGKTTLVELASILKKSKLLISGDSGPVHMACAVGTPVIALFRNDMPGKEPKRWGPWSGGSVVIEKNSLLDISVDDVLARIKQYR